MRPLDSAMQKKPSQNCQSGFSARVARSRHRLTSESIGKKYLCYVLRALPLPQQPDACAFIRSDFKMRFAWERPWNRRFRRSARLAFRQIRSRVFLMKKMKPMIKTTTMSIQVWTSMPKILNV
jgi:hypothetical protein